MLAPAPRLLLASLLALPACDDLLGSNKAPTKPSDDGSKAESTDVPSEEDGGDDLLPQPLVRAEHRLRFPGKAGENMGFSLTRLSELYALAGAVEIPEWSQPGEGATRLVRDDDLRTAWVCDPDEEQACAIGLHLPEPSEVAVIRIYAASAKGSTRPSRVRLHTPVGWAEARLADDDRPWNVTLGEATKVRSVTLEILETHGEGPVHLAELEVYGRSGAARPPLKLDPTRAVVTFESSPWRSKLRTQYATPSFIEQVDVDGRLHRLFPGTALIGRPGDRTVLIEHASWATCDDAQGTYDLLDLQTRVFVPLGDFGGFGGTAFAHDEGLGIALGDLDVDDGNVHALVIDSGRYERRTAGRLELRTPRQMLNTWGIDPTPLPRTDARTLGDLPAGCTPARSEDLAALEPHLPRRTKILAEYWYGCSLGAGARALVTTGGDCGREWHIGALDGDGKLLGLRSGKQSATHLRLRRLDGESLLVELWGNKDEPELILADVDGPRELSTEAALSLRPPGPCRKRCSMEMSDLRPKRD